MFHGIETDLQDFQTPWCTVDTATPPALTYSPGCRGCHALCAQGVRTHLDVECELLQTLQQGLLVAGYKGLHMGVDGGARLRRLLLHLELNTGGAERRRGERRGK